MTQVISKYRETRKRYKAKDPERWKKYCREYGQQLRDKLKIEVLTHYSPDEILGCSWEGCGVTDSDMLVLDHIADNGADQRRELGGGSNGRGWNFYRRLKRENFPIGFQTLCCNHNHKKEILRSRSSRLITA